RDARPAARPLEGRGAGRGRSGAPAALGRGSTARGCLTVPRGDRLGPRDSPRDDDRRHARLLAAAFRCPPRRSRRLRGRPVRILVTGASGFLGRHLVAHLTKRGDEVIALGVEPAQFEAGVRFVAADVRDRAEVREAIAAVEPERIVHLAALSHVGDSWKRMADYFEVNVLGTENVAAEKGNARLLFASTAEVYGQVPDDEQ